MQISRSFLAVCTAAVCCAFPLSSRAADTEAQIKAREALEKKLQELQSQQPEATSPPPATVGKEIKAPSTQVPAVRPPPPPPPAQSAPIARPTPPATPAAVPKPMPAPIPKAQPGTSPVLVVPPPADSEQIAKAREALRQKMNELQAQPSPTAPVNAPVVAKPQPAPRPQPVVKAPPVETPKPVAKSKPIEKPQPAKPAPVARTAPAPAGKMTSDKPIVTTTARPATASAPKVRPPPTAPKAVESAAAKPSARETRQMKQTAAADAKARTDAQKASQKRAAAKPKPAPAPKKTAALKIFQPIQGPASPLAGDKEQRLAELLQKYRSDQVTPEQYHAERAKILAEP